ncbi:hypothetical protein Fmac_014799 [Flemingia macrophylla]|uniref:Uncharacterized protein n=1 Tax=Flemingia macrophylla TaxID=520843 RepID=A0ABD1MCS3_9FABA
MLSTLQAYILLCRVIDMLARGRASHVVNHGDQQHIIEEMMTMINGLREENKVAQRRGEKMHQENARREEHLRKKNKKMRQMAEALR